MYSFWPELFFGIVESEAVAVRFNDMASMGNSIQQGASKTFGAKYLVPFLKREVGSYHKALMFICSTTTSNSNSAPIFENGIYPSSSRTSR